MNDEGLVNRCWGLQTLMAAEMDFKVTKQQEATSLLMITYNLLIQDVAFIYNSSTAAHSYTYFKFAHLQFVFQCHITSGKIICQC